LPTSKPKSKVQKKGSNEVRVMKEIIEELEKIKAHIIKEKLAPALEDFLKAFEKNEIPYQYSDDAYLLLSWLKKGSKKKRKDVECWFTNAAAARIFSRFLVRKKIVGVENFWFCQNGFRTFNDKMNNKDFKAFMMFFDALCDTYDIGNLKGGAATLVMKKSTRENLLMYHQKWLVLRIDEVMDECEIEARTSMSDPYLRFVKKLESSDDELDDSPSKAEELDTKKTKVTKKKKKGDSIEVEPWLNDIGKAKKLYKKGDSTPLESWFNEETERGKIFQEFMQKELGGGDADFLFWNSLNDLKGSVNDPKVYFVKFGRIFDLLVSDQAKELSGKHLVKKKKDHTFMHSVNLPGFVVNPLIKLHQECERLGYF